MISAREARINSDKNRNIGAVPTEVRDQLKSIEQYIHNCNNVGQTQLRLIKKLYPEVVYVLESLGYKIEFVSYKECGVRNFLKISW